MKILILGAGAIGGYFGGRMIQAGADVTFLVRERRASQLAANGLVVRSPHGDFSVPARWTQADRLHEPYDLVLLACKAYDLDDAIDSLRPAMGPSSHVLPLLNGIAHLERLAKVFGADRVVGGSCAIPATLSPQGEVIHLGAFHRIAFGMLAGSSPAARPKLGSLLALFSATPVDAVLSEKMMLEMWEKFVTLVALASMTCLMRAAVGDIIATEEGAALMQEAYDACARTARANGHPPRAAAIDAARKMLQDPASTVTASMLRDLESGHRTEGRHAVADMLRRARAAGVDPGPLQAAWCHLESHEMRMRREARQDG